MLKNEENKFQIIGTVQVKSRDLITHATLKFHDLSRFNMYCLCIHLYRPVWSTKSIFNPTRFMEQMQPGKITMTVVMGNTLETMVYLKYRTQTTQRKLYSTLADYASQNESFPSRKLNVNNLIRFSKQHFYKIRKSD